jgi:hypothetical protein
MIIEANPGDNIYSAIKKAKAALLESNMLEYNAAEGSKYARFNKKLTLMFNDVSVDISTDSNVDDIAVIYNLKSKIRRLDH